MGDSSPNHSRRGHPYREDARFQAINAILVANGQSCARKNFIPSYIYDNASFSELFAQFFCTVCHRNLAPAFLAPYYEMLAHQHEYHNATPTRSETPATPYAISAKHVAVLKAIFIAFRIDLAFSKDSAITTCLDERGPTLS